MLILLHQSKNNCGHRLPQFFSSPPFWLWCWEWPRGWDVNVHEGVLKPPVGTLASILSIPWVACHQSHDWVPHKILQWSDSLKVALLSEYTYEITVLLPDLANLSVLTKGEVPPCGWTVRSLGERWTTVQGLYKTKKIFITNKHPLQTKSTKTREHRTQHRS